MINCQLREYPINHNGGKRHKIFPRGSRACRHASPRCVDHHLVVRRLSGVHNHVLTRIPQEPTTSVIAQCHAQLVIPFGSSPGQGSNPHNSSTGVWRRQSPTPHNLHNLLNRLGTGKCQEQQENPRRPITQVPLR